MTIFGKFFMCKNGFSLTTHLFKTIQTSSPVATHTKSGMPRRSKGSKQDFKIFIFPGPIFVRSRLFVVSDFFLLGTFSSLVLKVFEGCEGGRGGRRFYTEPGKLPTTQHNTTQHILRAY